MRILLVEDDELFRLGLRMRLQQETGLEIVAEAEDGETAVELANSYLLDLVLLDVGLHCSGYGAGSSAFLATSTVQTSAKSFSTSISRDAFAGNDLKRIAALCLLTKANIAASESNG